MAVIWEIERKTPVLTRPTLPCLSHCHAINLLAGCPFECRYCYAQSFRSNPGPGTVLFYSNTFDRLRQELPRKHNRPVCVYFSTACEPFIPYQPVLDMLYDSMKLLLVHGVSLLISTKSSIPSRFLDLFTGYSSSVHVQVGLTTADDSVRRAIEPTAPPVQTRTTTLSCLINAGISAEVRMDPLIPGLTDTEESLSGLCAMIAGCGVTNAAASYLFLRRGNIRRMMVMHNEWSFSDIAEKIFTDRINKYCGHGTIRVPSARYRSESYHRLISLAGEHGITVSLCHCKNPDITSERCHPDYMKRHDEYCQTSLFK